LTQHTGREFVKHVVPAVLKPARTLWNEVIGFLFLCFATIFGFRAVRTYFDFDGTAPAEATGHLLSLIGFGFITLLMLYFGVTSFLRARKISRS
jgi:hypothetical protein